MKLATVIATVALACGSAAFAQSSDNSARGEESVRADQQEHGQANEKMRNGAHRLGEKMRHGMHRLGDKLHANGKDSGHHARNHHRNDTRAMGAPGSDSRADSGRQQRMDDAYANWRARQDKQNR
jgi:hypothetical protein